MRSVKIGELKAKLSAHLQLVRDGEEVMIFDRSQPIARLVPVRAGDYSEQEQRLIARGALIPPLRKRKAKDAPPEPQGRVSDARLNELWKQEREGR